MRRTSRTRLCLALIALNLAFIWGNSCLPGEFSGALSNWLGDVLEIGNGTTGAGRSLLRKLAHFTEFAWLGFLLAWLASLKGERGFHAFAPALLGGLLTACIDESIQLITPDRGPSLVDVWIDTSGALTGVIALFGVYYFDSWRNQQ